MVITCFHHSWSWSSKLVQFESGDGLTGNQMIQSEYRLVAMACAYFLEKQRKKVKPNLKLMALLDLHMNHGSRCWAIPCCYVDCMKCFKVQGKFIIDPVHPNSNGTQHWHLTMASSMAPRPDYQSVSKPHPPIASSNGTQQWHAIGIYQWHPAVAPSNGTPPHGTQQSHLTMAPSIQQWHPAMAPSIQQWHPPWHPAMVCNGKARQPAMAPRPVCQSVITTPRLLHPAMAPYHIAPSNGTWPWHPAMAPRPVCQSVS